MNTVTKIVYVTASPFKIAEAELLRDKGKLGDGTPIGQLFDFDFRQVPIKEILEIDMRVMVQEEVAKAYSQLKVPCIVEHAGLIFENRKGKQYPGGLTKPMWDSLGEDFVEETHSANRPAIATAVVAYCDGMQVRTFVGERTGRIAPRPRGDRQFYWDTVFIPNDESRRVEDLTYAEIVADSRYGLGFKILELSQSARALMEFLEFRRHQSCRLWP